MMDKMTQGSAANPPRIEEKKTKPFKEVIRRVKEKIKDLKLVDFLVIIGGFTLLMMTALLSSFLMRGTEKLMENYPSILKGCAVVTPVLFLVAFTVSGGYRILRELATTMLLVVVILLILAVSQGPSSEAANALKLMANPSRIWAMITEFYKTVVVPWVTGA